VREVTSGLRFPEGPIALLDGAVLVVEIAGGALTRVEPDGEKHVVAECGGGPNGAAFGPDGAVYVCNDGGLACKTEDGITFPYGRLPGNDGGTLQRVDLADGSVDNLYTHCDGERIGGLNDIVFDVRGWCYFVDTMQGRLYYANPDGSEIICAASELALPNGMGLSPDGDRLYVSETYTGRVVAWDVLGDGTLVPRGMIHQAQGHGWDGLAIDGAGNVCIANLQQSGVTILSPDGGVRGEVTVPLHDPYVTNVCFGGTDGTTAFICSSGRGRLYATEWPFPGLRLNYAR
jgi:gluconolactonase